MKTRLQNVWERLRANFWFVPALMASGAVLLALAMINLDETLRDTAVAQLSWTYRRGPEGARALLSTVAGSVITVAGVTFSITIAALTLASSQFGPRLLRNFLRDAGNQIVLGTFIATFLYCLLVLRSVHGNGEEAFVPDNAVAVGVGLAIASIGVLIYFIHHVSVSIQIDTIVTTVGRDLDAAIDRIFPEKLGHGQPRRPQPEVEPHSRDGAEYAVRATDSGYVQAIDNDGLMRIATEHDLVILLLCRPGEFVVRDQDLARAWPHKRLDHALTQEIMSVYIFGSQRTLNQDILFAIQQLAEIAVRALSPGINDPFTAISCVDRLGASLCHLAERSLPDAHRYDLDGHLRVIASLVSFAEIIDSAFDQIRQYGRTNTSVTIRLLEMIARVIAYARDDDLRSALLRQAEMIARGSWEGLPEELDRATVAARYQIVTQAHDGVGQRSKQRTGQ